MEHNNNKLLERFLSYVKTWTTSDSEAADKGIQPSTARQMDFAFSLAEELKCVLQVSATVTKHGYVYALIPPSKGFENRSTIGFLSHMDTVDEVSGENVKPVLTQADDGDTIIKSDGTTLLGADDKAGVAEIITAAEELVHSSINHGTIELIFSPDEETGHGMDNVPLDIIKSKTCFTLDGGHIGELEVECFNAYKSVITFVGKPKHTGTARPDMVNAVTLAASFVSMLPRHESPETTDGYQGFYAPMSIEGTIEKAVVTIFVRDFTVEGMKRRLDTIAQIAQAIEIANVGSSIRVENKEQYKNMKEELEKHPEIITNLKKAAQNIGVTPVFSPIRGGTDGSRLTEMGIPTPNIFTGGHNFHSKSEWASLFQMNKAKDMVLELIKIYSEKTDNA